MNIFTIDVVMIKLLTLMGPYWNFFSYVTECCHKVYIAARTDTTQQTNFCLGLHLQICVATFNLTCLSRLLPTIELIFFSLLVVSDVNISYLMYAVMMMMVGTNFC